MYSLFSSPISSSIANVEMGSEGRAGLVHQQHVGRDGDRARDAQTLLLTTREAAAGLVEAVLDLVPEVGALQRLLDEGVGVAARHALVVELRAGQHVLADRHGRERVGALEDHADVTTHEHGVDTGTVEVVAVDEHAALHVTAGDDLVHAVEGAQERGLAAAGGSDERGDRAGLDVDRDALDREEVAVVDVEVLDLDALGHE
ncbi:hypothetical protein QE430_002993 [Microbacterium testaceum]|nr:hypothetical protein [Microbacterium testaceum]